MIPADEYCRVRKDITLFEALQFIDNAKAEKKLAHHHHDLLVEDEHGKIVGKMTMIDIFHYMEPSYLKMTNQKHPNALSKDFVQKIYTDFNLWSEPLNSLCAKCSGVKVEEVMHTPKPTEYLDEEDSLDKALHAFVLGIHQPLLVRKAGTVTGVLRLGDVFEEVKNSILACEI